MPYQLRDLEDAAMLPTGQLRTAQADLLDIHADHGDAEHLYADGVDMSDRVDEQQRRIRPALDAVWWLEGYLFQIWRHGADGNWWRHADAVTIIEALWRSWEHLRTEGPTGMAVWLRDYLTR